MPPYIYPVIETAEIETTFLELAEQWRRETRMLQKPRLLCGDRARLFGVGMDTLVFDC